jgi:arabinogalactan oligomer/maltooligosaccharide transport system substrate-binding protein
MNKKLVSVLTAAVCVCSVFGGALAASADEAVEAAEGAETVEVIDKTITVWCPEELTAFTEEMIGNFQEANPDYADYTVTVEAVGESDAAYYMMTDVEGGADIFHFTQDQLASLVSAGALTPAGDTSNWVKEQNDAGSVYAATWADTIYAYPLTSDSGYFLYYDKSVISDPTTIEGILSDCETAGKDFYMEINSGWYQPAFFLGTGCDLVYETDDLGGITSAKVTYASPEGLKALKAMIALTESTAFRNGSSISDAPNCAAIVDGTWDSSAAKDLFGENCACTKLPTFSVDDEEYQMSGFGGFRLLGIKPQTDADKLAAIRAISQYLAGAEVQLERYLAAGWGPSNKAAQASEAVQADAALSALAQQLIYTVPQGQYPADYWTLATSLGDTVISGELTGAADTELMGVLQSFQDACIACAE